MSNNILPIRIFTSIIFFIIVLFFYFGYTNEYVQSYKAEISINTKKVYFKKNQTRVLKHNISMLILLCNICYYLLYNTSSVSESIIFSYYH